MTTSSTQNSGLRQTDREASGGMEAIDGSVAVNRPAFQQLLALTADRPESCDAGTTRGDEACGFSVVRGRLVAHTVYGCGG